MTDDQSFVGFNSFFYDQQPAGPELSEAWEKVRGLLRDHAYREGEFDLSSGRTSTYYLDGKLVTLAPEAIDPLGGLFADAILPHEVEAVGGLTIGADPIVTATSAAAWRRGHKIPGFLIRKSKKGHGLGKRIEGPLPDGARVAIVDDVVTSGGSVLEATEAANDAGCRVAVVVALVDRLEGGRENIERAGYEFEALFTVEDLRDRAPEDAEALTT